MHLATKTFKEKKKNEKWVGSVRWLAKICNFYRLISLFGSYVFYLGTILLWNGHCPLISVRDLYHRDRALHMVIDIFASMHVDKLWQVDGENKIDNLSKCICSFKEIECKNLL